MTAHEKSPVEVPQRQTEEEAEEKKMGAGSEVLSIGNE